jgi:hypothetical protein
VDSRRSPSGARRRSSATFARRLISLTAGGILLFETLGPLTPTAWATAPGDIAQEPVDRRVEIGSNGRAVEAAPAPITVPAGGGSSTTDPTIGEPPLFLPYTPPVDTVELTDERTEQSRTLANPDGTFTTELSEGPINFKDDAGAWQPIDLSLVKRLDGDGFKVAAHGSEIAVAGKDGSIGSIALGDHLVSLSAPL